MLEKNQHIHIFTYAYKHKHKHRDIPWTLYTDYLYCNIIIYMQSKNAKKNIVQARIMVTMNFSGCQ